MPTTNIAKRIVDTIRAQSKDEEQIQEFILAILQWEMGTKGAYQFKDNYRHLIKTHSSKWGDEK